MLRKSYKQPIIFNNWNWRNSLKTVREQQNQLQRTLARMSQDPDFTNLENYSDDVSEAIGTEKPHCPPQNTWPENGQPRPNIEA